MNEREESAEEIRKLLRDCGAWLGDGFCVTPLTTNQFFITLPVQSVFRDRIMLHASVSPRGKITVSDCNAIHDDFRFNGWGISYSRNVIRDVVKHIGISYFDRENKREIIAYIRVGQFNEKLRKMVAAIVSLDSLMLFKPRSHKNPGTPQKDV